MTREITKQALEAAIVRNCSPALSRHACSRSPASFWRRASTSISKSWHARTARSSLRSWNHAPRRSRQAASRCAFSPGDRAGRWCTSTDRPCLSAESRTRMRRALSTRLPPTTPPIRRSKPPARHWALRWHSQRLPRGCRTAVKRLSNNGQKRLQI